MASQNVGRPAAANKAASAIAEAATAAAPREDLCQYVTFTVGREEYGIAILAVREIRGWTPENRLPNMPDHVRGVINLRGCVIPITDLRARFGGGMTDASKSHVVVVVQVGDAPRGVLVDAISDILTVARAQIKPVPALQSGMDDADALVGLFTVENRMVTLLDVDRLLSGDHLGHALSEASQVKH